MSSETVSASALWGVATEQHYVRNGKDSIFNDTQQVLDAIKKDPSQAKAVEERIKGPIVRGNAFEMQRYVADGPWSPKGKGQECYIIPVRPLPYDLSRRVETDLKDERQLSLLMKAAPAFGVVLAAVINPYIGAAALGATFYHYAKNPPSLETSSKEAPDMVGIAVPVRTLRKHIAAYADVNIGTVARDFLSFSKGLEGRGDDFSRIFWNSAGVFTYKAKAPEAKAPAPAPSVL